MEITFDPAKRDITLRERGLDFADAAKVFAGLQVEIEDDRFDYGERRYLVASRIDEKPYYIVLVPRDGTVRVLSARRMHEKEARRYGI